MIQKLLFSFSVFAFLMTSCGCGGDDCSGRQINNDYKYSVQDFEKLCKDIENKKIPAVRLQCMFLGKYDSSTTKDQTTYTFILDKNPEALDTCWGLVNYDVNSQVVKDCGVVCQ
jgi:hypothetical protein